MSAPVSASSEDARRDQVRKAAWSAALAASVLAGKGNLFGVAARSAQGAGATPAEAVSIAQTLEDVLRRGGDPGVLTSEETIEQAIVAAQSDLSSSESVAQGAAASQVSSMSSTAPDIGVFRTNLLELGKANRDQWFTLDALDSRFPGTTRPGIEAALDDLTREGFVRREGDYLFVTEPGLRFLEYSQLAK